MSFSSLEGITSLFPIGEYDTKEDFFLSLITNANTTPINSVKKPQQQLSIPNPASKGTLSSLIWISTFSPLFSVNIISYFPESLILISPIYSRPGNAY